MEDFASAGIVVASFATTIFIILLVLAFLVVTYLAYAKLFKAAGFEAWEAWVPGLNIWRIAQISFGSQYGWVGLVGMFASLIPVVGGILSVVITFYMSYMFAKAFGASQLVSILFMLSTPIVLIYWLVTGNYMYMGTQDNYVDKLYTKYTNKA